MARPRGSLAIPAAAVVLTLIVSLVLWTRGDLNSLICDGDCGPAYVTAPRALTSSSEPARVRPDASPTGALDPAKLEAAVSDALGDDALGDHVGLTVVGATGEVLVSKGAGTYIPASTAKLLTGFAALSKIGPQHRFETSVVAAGDRLVLVGGGDPYLLIKKPEVRDRAVAADLTTLAKRTAAVLKRDGVSEVSLGYDTTLFTGPAASPDWDPSYISANIVTPVSALWADQGEANGIRSRDPALSAGKIFSGLLEDRGIRVTGGPAAATAPDGARKLASMKSATVAQIVDAMIRTSDNQAAEVMLRHVAIASDRPATFDGGAKAVTQALTGAGIDTTGLRIRDGSGLSREDRASPTTLAQTVMASLAGLQTATLLTDLPVSGFNGTLLNRFSRSQGAYGLVRAKTGTLTGVHSLAGYAVDAKGRPVIFALMSDGTPAVPLLTAEAAIDRVAAAIAACSCGTTP